MNYSTPRAGTHRSEERTPDPLAKGLDYCREPKPRERNLSAGPAQGRPSDTGGGGAYYEFFCTDWFMPEPEGAANDSRTRWSTGRTPE